MREEAGVIGARGARFFRRVAHLKTGRNEDAIY
jgi:hypothetical protein